MATLFRIALLAAPLLAFAGCSDELDDGRAGDAGTSDDARGMWDPGKADASSSCVDACGGQSAGGCWCDDVCGQWGDCCADVMPLCGFDDGGAGQDPGSDEGQGGAVTVEQLLALTQTCNRLPGVGLFKTDANKAPDLEICELDGAVFWHADADIDCDGGTSTQCRNDPWYQSQTSAKDSSGNFIDSSTIAHIVVPSASNGFNPASLNIKTSWAGRGSVGAIIYDGQLIYAPYADSGPKGVLGELSNAAAKILGIPSSPISGGVPSGVTYIMFTDADNVVDPIESAAKAQEVGEMLAQRLLQNNSGG